jgi:hypothetical protein
MHQLPPTLRISRPPIARSARVSRWQAAALMDQLEEAGVRDVRWESVLNAPSTR